MKFVAKSRMPLWWCECLQQEHARTKASAWAYNFSYHFFFVEQKNEKSRKRRRKIIYKNAAFHSHFYRSQAFKLPLLRLYTSVYVLIYFVHSPRRLKYEIRNTYTFTKIHFMLATTEPHETREKKIIYNVDEIRFFFFFFLADACGSSLCLCEVYMRRRQRIQLHKLYYCVSRAMKTHRRHRSSRFKHDFRYVFFFFNSFSAFLCAVWVYLCIRVYNAFTRLPCVWSVFV